MLTNQTNKVKFITSVLLLVLLLIGFVGCGKNKDIEEETTSPTQTETELPTDPQECSLCKTREIEVDETKCKIASKCHECGELFDAYYDHMWEDATCEESSKCSVCGETQGMPLGHVFESYINDNNATCTSNETKTAPCERGCGKYDVVHIDGTKKEHTYEETGRIEPTCTSTGAVTYTCTECGNSIVEQIAVAGHMYGDWTITLEPTTSSTGARERTCTQCYYVSKETIPVKQVPSGHSIVLSQVTESTLTAPKEEDFAQYYDHAVKLYNAIVNGEEMCYLFFEDSPFTSDSYKKEHAMYKEFKDIFERKVLNNKAAIVEDCFVTGAFPEGAGLLRVDIFSGDILRLANMFYEANRSAGLYDGMSAKDAVIKINNWICNTVTYTQGYTTAEDALNGKAQCCGYAKLFYYMCKNIGVECSYITGCVYSSDISTTSCPSCHAWNKVKIGGNWYYVDVCWNDTVSGNKYLLSDVLWENRAISSINTIW